MVNEIKLDAVNSLATIKKVNETTKETKTKIAPQEIMVSNQLSELISTLVAENSATGPDQRVLEVKNRIEAGKYVIDNDALAAKIYQDMFAKTIGI